MSDNEFKVTFPGGVRVDAYTDIIRRKVDPRIVDQNTVFSGNTRFQCDGRVGFCDAVPVQ